MHQAIHVEIETVVIENSWLVRSADLLNQLKDQELPLPWVFNTIYAFFSLLVIGAILLIGEGNARDAIKRLKSEKKQRTFNKANATDAKSPAVD